MKSEIVTTQMASDEKVRVHGSDSPFSSAMPGALYGTYGERQVLHRGNSFMSGHDKAGNKARTQTVRP